MSNASDIKLFEGYSLLDLFKLVLHNSRLNRKNIKLSISLVTDQVENISDVQIMSPLIVNYLNTMIKNDLLLIKLSQTATRLIDQKIQVLLTSTGLTLLERKHLILQANKLLLPLIRLSRKIKQDVKKIG